MEARFAMGSAANTALDPITIGQKIKKRSTVTTSGRLLVPIGAFF